MEDPGYVVERLADINPAPNEVGTGLVDVVNRELHTLGRAWRG
jgi:hypothetical protein